MKSQIFKLSTGIAGAYHLILGIIALALPVDTVIQVITLAFGTVSYTHLTLPTKA